MSEQYDEMAGQPLDVKDHPDRNLPDVGARYGAQGFEKLKSLMNEDIKQHRELKQKLPTSGLDEGF